MPHAPYRVSAHPEPAAAELTALQSAQLSAALAYHALVAPGAEFEVRVTVGDPSQMPVLTGPATARPLGGEQVAALTVASLAAGSRGAGSSGSTGVRHIRIGHADASPATTRPPTPLSLPRRIYRLLERTAPTLADTVREAVMGRRERAISGPLPRYAETADAPVIDALPEPEEGPPAILFGMHWLQTGGAERWAVEAIQIAKDLGFLPVVVTDQNSVHPWLARPELEGCAVIAMSFEGAASPLDLGIARAIAENYRLRGIALHHSHWLYQALPWFKRWRPGIPVVDSLHIVEYLGGGYPGLAVRYDEFIDVHHTISPELDRWLAEVQGVDRAKLVMAPLTALTVEDSQEFAPRDPQKPFTIAYVGRLSRQKRPDVYLSLVHALVKRGIAVRAILHGDGELQYLVTALIRRFGLEGVIEQRLEDHPVAETLADADLLVVTSLNEGLTLTTFEAVAAGVPVLSTDVGSQRTVVRPPLLLPRPARRFVRRACERIAALAASETARRTAWEQQRDRVVDFARNPDAHRVMKELFTKWQA